MSSPVLAFETWHSAADAWSSMRAERVRHAVVMNDGKVLGIISDRDLGGPRGGSLRIGRAVGELMTRDVVVASPRMTVERVARTMDEKHVGCMPVVERGQLVGLVTRGDLLRALTDHAAS